MTIKAPVSPQATGGAGTLFEYRVAAVMLSALMSESPPPGLAVPVRAVGLQQRVLGHLLDDIVLYGDGSLSDGFCCEIQVKRTLAVTAKDSEFIDVVTQTLHAIVMNEEKIAIGDLGLGVAAGGNAKALAELKFLTGAAGAHMVSSTFYNSIPPGVAGQRYRNRLSHVKRAVSAAIAAGAPDLGGADETTYRLLHHLRVLHMAVDEEGSHTVAALDQLQHSLAEEFDASAGDLLEHLAGVAQAWGTFAGVMDEGMVRRRLRRRGLRRREGNPPEQSLDKVDADAVIRGPISALDLQEDLAEARELVGSDDLAAAGVFAKIEERLRQANFHPHADMIAAQRAEALDAAGEHAKAVDVSVDLAWKHLDDVRPWEAHFALLKGEDTRRESDSAPPHHRALFVADRAVWVAKGGPLSSFVNAFDELQPGDPHELRAAVFLLEEAVAAGFPETVRARLDTLKAIVARFPRVAKEQIKQFRLRAEMCLADVTGEWLALLRTVKQRDSPQMLAWAMARHARYLALTGDGPGAQDFYLEAVERASAAEMFDEAADWLYALRTVRFWYDNNAEEQVSEHAIAQALRPYTKVSSLPGSAHTAELALRSAQDESRVDTALQRSLRWRWQTVVRAQLTDEFSAAETIGRLLTKKDEPQHAAAAHVSAGSVKGAVAAAKLLPEETIVVPLPTHWEVPIQRAAAFSMAAHAFDRVADGEAQFWVERALLEAISGNGRAWIIEPSPVVQAFELLCAAVPVMVDHQIDRYIDLAQGLNARPLPGHRRVSRTVARTLLALAEAGRSDALPPLIGLLLHDPVAGPTICEGMSRASGHVPLLQELLDSTAPENPRVFLALVRAGVERSPAVLAQARVTLERQWPTKTEGTTSKAHYHAPDDAELAGLLDDETRTRFAELVLSRVEDVGLSYEDRWNNLAALINISANLDDATRARCLPRLMDLARSPRAELDRFWHREDRLPDLALRCAALMSPNAARTREIEEIALANLRDHDEEHHWRIGRTLADLSSEHSRLDPKLLAVHSSPAMRAVAAHRWRGDPSALSSELVRALATDSNPRVRATVAEGAWEHGNEDAALVEVLSTDARRSIRDIVNRSA